MIIFRLFLMITAFFMALVLGLATALFFGGRKHMRHHSMEESTPHHPGYRDNGKTIEGEYKVLDESHKEKE